MLQLSLSLAFRCHTSTDEPKVFDVCSIPSLTMNVCNPYVHLNLSSIHSLPLCLLHLMRWVLFSFCSLWRFLLSDDIVNKCFYLECTFSINICGKTQIRIALFDIVTIQLLLVLICFVTCILFSSVVFFLCDSWTCQSSAVSWVQVNVNVVLKKFFLLSSFLLSSFSSFAYVILCGTDLNKS